MPGLDLKDVEYVMERVEGQTEASDSVKEKSKVAVQLFQNMADKRSVLLKLRK